MSGTPATEVKVGEWFTILSDTIYVVTSIDKETKTIHFESQNKSIKTSISFELWDCLGLTNYVRLKS